MFTASMARGVAAAGAAAAVALVLRHVRTNEVISESVNASSPQATNTSNNTKIPHQTSSQSVTHSYSDSGNSTKSGRIPIRVEDHFPTSHHMLHSALNGTSKLERYDLHLVTEGPGVEATVRFGDTVCGHPGITHGGAIASVFDDSFGVLFFSLRLGTGFTANLSVDYRKPIPAGATVEYRLDVDRVEGRKVYMKGVAKNAQQPEIVYAEASALFITKHVPSSASSVAKFADRVKSTEEQKI